MKAKFLLAVRQEQVTNVRESDANMNLAKPVYAEDDVLIPNPELTKREFKPLAAFSGYKVVAFYKSWGSMKLSLNRPLPLNVAVFDGSDIDIMLQSSGLSRVVLYETPGDDQTPVIGYEYKPDTYNTKTMSIDVIGEEHKFKGHGAKCAFSISAKSGDPVMISFDMSAAFDDVEEGVFAPPFLTPPEASMLDENNIYGHVKIGADEAAATRAEIDEFTLDMGADVLQKKTFKTNAFRIKEFYPTVSLKGDVDVENPYSVDEVVSGEAKALVVRIKDKVTLSDAQDPTSGKVKWEIVVPTMTPDKLPILSDQDGLGYLDQSFNANPTSGNDNYVIRYFI